MSSKSRIQLDLNEAQKAELMAICAKLDAASYSEVFRRSMHIYGRILEEESKGRKFGFVDEEFTFYEIVFI